MAIKTTKKFDIFPCLRNFLSGLLLTPLHYSLINVSDPYTKLLHFVIYSMIVVTCKHPFVIRANDDDMSLHNLKEESKFGPRGTRLYYDLIA